MTDQEMNYRALLTKDRRFDGRFFTAVLTTGIYCRPICPARTPKRENVRFYSSAWAAEAAGFRPCLRCCPEAAPGSPEWMGTEGTVARAVRLIEDGLLEHEGLSELARRVGVGDRQLRRLFSEHLGAAPIAVAQTRRVQTSKLLLDQSDLPLAQIAFAAGFSSVRRFNAVFLATYGRPPSAFRRKSGQPGCLSLALAYRPPFSWPHIVDYLKPRLFPSCETIDDRGYRRLHRTDTGFAEISVVPGQDALILKLPVSLLPSLRQLRARTRRMFDLDSDPLRIAEQLSDLSPSPERIRVPGAWDPFETAVRIILGQRVSVKAAATMAGRLIAEFGEAVGSGPLSHLFPRPSVLAQARLESIGLPQSRAEALRRLSQAVAQGLDLQILDGGEELRQALLEIPGIGPWTVSMLALRLGDPDAFPSGDLVLRQRLGSGSAAELTQRAERWKPFRSYAAMALWLQS